jgi:uracil-DNA glycosylase
VAERIGQLEAEIRACRLCAGRFAATRTAHLPQPVVRLSGRAPVMIASQAAGLRAHGSGLPFDDASGDRLRFWLGVSRSEFYDRDRFTIAPMAFCFPGYDAKGGDLPPPKLCAATWRARVMAAMPQVRLAVLIGGYAQTWHLGTRNVTEAVARWREFGLGIVPLPHPSWRNTGWLKRNPWFEAELVPVLRARVAEALAARAA